MLCNHACMHNMHANFSPPAIHLIVIPYMMIILSMCDIGGVVPDWTVLNLMIDLCQVSYWPHWLSMAALLFRGELLVHISVWANIFFYEYYVCVYVIAYSNQGLNFDDKLLATG